MSGVPFEVSLPADHFDLELCVSSGQVFRWIRHPQGGWLGIDGDRWYRVTLPLGGGQGGGISGKRDAITYVSEPKQAGLNVTYQVETNGTENDFCRLFRLDTDMAEIRAEILRRGSEIEPYLGSLEGLRLMRPSDSIETFFSFLCTPNNNLPRIVSMVAGLSSFGPILAKIDGMEFRRFPAADTIAGIPESDLRERKFGYRAATIPRAAEELVRRGGRGYLEQLKSASYEEAHIELLSFHGIGRKLADCIALFALHHTRAMPVDTHIWNAAVRLYFPQWQGTSITDLKYQTIGNHLRDRFGDYAGWTQQFLFFDSVLNWRSRGK